MVDVKEIFTHGMRRDVVARPVSGGIPASVWQAYSAFANTSGGIILLGAEEKKETKMYIPRGVRTPERLQIDLWTALSDRRRISANILFKEKIYPVSFEGITVIVIEVPRAERSQRPVYVGQDVFLGTYLRIRGENVLCGRELIQSMMRFQDSGGADGKLFWRYRLDALSESTIARYRAVFASCRPGHPYNDMDNEEFLVRIRAAARNEDRKLCPSLAGLLFFGKKEVLAKEFPYLFLDYRELSLSNHCWVNRVSTRDGEWSGNLFDFYCRIIDPLTRIHGSWEDDPSGLTKKNHIQQGLEEALINALIHADYVQGSGILIDKGENWVTISNPGTFLCDLDFALAGGASETRNIRMKKMFSWIRIGMPEGEGLKKIQEAWKEANWKKPELKESFEAGRSTLIMPLNTEDIINAEKEVKENAEGEETLLQEQGMSSAKARALICYPEYPTELDLDLYDFLCAGYAQSVKDLSRISGQTEEKVERSLRHLKELGYLRRLGTVQGGWETTEFRTI